MTKIQKISIGVAAALVIIGGGAAGLIAITHSNAQKLQEQIQTNLSDLKTKLPEGSVIEEVSSSVGLFESKGQIKVILQDKTHPEMTNGVLASYEIKQNLFSPITGYYDANIVMDPIGPLVETIQFKNKGAGPFLKIHKDSSLPQDQLVFNQNPIQFTLQDKKLGNIVVDTSAANGTATISATADTFINYNMDKAQATNGDDNIQATKISGVYKLNYLANLQPGPQVFSKEISIQSIDFKKSGGEIQNLKVQSSGTLENQKYTLSNNIQLGNLDIGQIKGVSGDISTSVTLSNVNELKQAINNIKKERGDPTSKEEARATMAEFYKTTLQEGITVSLNKFNLNSPSGNLSLQAKFETQPNKNNQPFTLYQNSTINVNGSIVGEFAKPARAFISPMLGLPPTADSGNEFKTSLSYDNGTVKVNGTDTSVPLSALFGDKLKAVDVALGFSTPPAVDYNKMPFPESLRLKVKTNLTLPSNITGNPAVVLRIKESKDGTVEDVQLTKSSGNKELDDAVIAAVKKSSPLPKDGDKDADPMIDITYFPFPLDTKK